MRLLKNRKWECLLFAIGCIVGMAYVWNAGFTASGDDEVYRTAISTWGSWAKWAAAYYEKWSGRVILHSMLIVLTNMHVIVWRAASALMVALTCWLIYRTVLPQSTGKAKSTLVFMLAVGAWRLIPNLRGAVKWAAGSVNYLYPVAMLLVCLLLFYAVLSERTLKLTEKFWGGISCVICGNMEQSAAVLFAMGVLFFLYIHVYWIKEKRFDRRKDLVYLLVIWGLNTIIMLISYFAPGNQYRYEMEMFRCVGYDMYSIIDRALLGLQRFILDVSAPQGFVLWMLPAGISMLFAMKNRDIKRICAAAGYIVLAGIQNIVVRKVLDIQFVYPFNRFYALWIVFTVFLLFYNGYVIVQCLNNYRDKFWFLFIYLGAIAASVVAGFSPTLYVSAGRTAYITYVLLILTSAKCLSDRLSEKSDGISVKFSVEKLNGILCTLLSTVIVVGFIADNHAVERYSIVDMYEDVSLIGENLVIDREKGRISVQTDVDRFMYDVDNWCTEEGEEPAIDLAIGILDCDTGKTRLYKTCPQTEWPVMDTFPDNKVKVVAYFWQGTDLKPNESYILVATDPEGNIAYNTL